VFYLFKIEIFIFKINLKTAFLKFTFFCKRRFAISFGRTGDFLGDVEDVEG
jgi:hypothetical protein